METNNASPEIQVLADDLLSPDCPVAASQFPTMPAPSNLLMNRSLENILLDGSPLEESIDLGGETMSVERSHALPPSSLVSGHMEKVEGCLGDEDNVDVEILACPDEGSIDNFKGIEIGDTLDSEKVSFDDIVCSVEEIVVEEKENSDQNKEGMKNKEKDVPNQDISFESFGKVLTGDAVPVRFVEEKGMRAAESTRSLMKFFTDSTGGTDVEGKGFFDSFTAGEVENEQTSQVTDVEKISATSQSSVPSSPRVVIPSMSISSCSVGSPAAKGLTPLPFFQVPPLGGGAELEVELLRQLSTDGAALSETSGLELGLTDVFSSCMSNEDRMYDAWIPSEMTRQMLVSVLTSALGSFRPLSSTQLSLPGVIVEESLGDPVRDLVQRCIGDTEANKRLVLNADSVPQDEVGLCQLIKAGCLRAAVDLTSRLLTKCGQGLGALNQVTKHTPQSLQLWFCRLSLLVKLKLFTQAENELQAFGNLDSPDLYYDYHQDAYPMRRGSLVPFDMRILHAELPQYVGQPQDTLDRLCYMQAVIAKILSNLNEGLAEDGSMLELSVTSRETSRELWKKREERLLYSMGSCLLNIKDYGSAIEIYKQLMKKNEKEQVELQNAIGCVYLQMGDTEKAMKYFQMAEAGSPPTTDAIKCRNIMNRGLVALGNNQFLEAYQLFKEVTDIDKNNVMAVNNMAVCSLYLGRLKESLTALESLVYYDPRQNLQEGILLNLSTLYELESSRALQKKQSLLCLVSEHKGNGFNVACLKMA